MTYSYFSTDTASTEIFTLSLHDALPISGVAKLLDALREAGAGLQVAALAARAATHAAKADPKSTRLNSSHTVISYAVLLLKNKLSLTRHMIPLRSRHTKLHTTSAQLAYC